MLRPVPSRSRWGGCSREKRRPSQPRPVWLRYGLKAVELRDFTVFTLQFVLSCCCCDGWEDANVADARRVEFARKWDRRDVEPRSLTCVRSLVQILLTSASYRTQGEASTRGTRRVEFARKWGRRDLNPRSTDISGLPRYSRGSSTRTDDQSVARNISLEFVTGRYLWSQSPCRAWPRPLASPRMANCLKGVSVIGRRPPSHSPGICSR